MWLSLFAYIIRIGNKLGLVKTESESPDGRAYVRAHDALHWLRTHLVGCELESVEETAVSFRQHGRRNEIRLAGSQLQLAVPSAEGLAATPLTFDPKGLDAVELGPKGFVRFAYQDGGLNVVVCAGDDSLGRHGQHQSQLRFVVPFP